MLVDQLQYHDTVIFVQDSGTGTVGSGARRGTKPWRGHSSGTTFRTGSTSELSAPTTVYTYRQWKRGLVLWQATSSLQAVVVDDALIQDDGLDLIVGELDRCWEVTQKQDK